MRHIKNGNSTAVDLAEVEQTLDTGGLARAVDTDQTKALTLAYRQAKTVENRVTSVPLDETVKGECGWLLAVHTSAGVARHRERTPLI